MKTYKFKTNINCGGCVKAVTPRLNDLDEVKSWRVNTDHPDKVLEVTSESENQQKVITAVEQAGFKAQPISEN